MTSACGVVTTQSFQPPVSTRPNPHTVDAGLPLLSEIDISNDGVAGPDNGARTTLGLPMEEEVWYTNGSNCANGIHPNRTSIFQFRTLDSWTPTRGRRWRRSGWSCHLCVMKKKAARGGLPEEIYLQESRE